MNYFELHKDDNPFCSWCAEPNCMVGSDDQCEMIRKYLASLAGSAEVRQRAAKQKKNQTVYGVAPSERAINETDCPATSSRGAGFHSYTCDSCSDHCHLSYTGRATSNMPYCCPWGVDCNEPNWKQND